MKSEKTISINIRASIFLPSVLIANCELRIANWNDALVCALFQSKARVVPVLGN
ncbi:hypothetical protein GXM_09807 [Nostoc sphaeroides CCNUC1]|uniref:Uncharacterized protein n=1 Tax=Nostoc sphaeroides CCNUC1 TaxID=2653204 RepID=A0A5P8WHH9_9NOSO|nr:hypothetical protein GXM_09807 [Nostoc sphaeroides CCNUC1]